MKMFNRSIPIAIDKATGEIIDANEIFSVKKDAFQIRKSFHEKEFDPKCLECDQDLDVSGSKFDRIHFKHKRGAEVCVLSDPKISFENQLIFSNILIAKESDRHILLKNKIGKLLEDVEGVERDSISIDRKFIFGKGGKRKPDVYCKYLGKEIVFEIQLSNLSLGYILNRYNFYKDNGIYLIWILDNFDVHNQKTLERDIKYLARFENFFKLDESKSELSLQCDYKGVFLTDNNEVWSRWQNKSVTLNELKFDNNLFQVYFYDFDENKKKTEDLKQLILDKKDREEKERIAKIRETKAAKITDDIIKELTYLKKNAKQYYWKVTNMINELSAYELELLNKKLKLKERFDKGESPLVKVIEDASEKEWSLINFMLNNNGLYLDVNAKGKSGKTVLQAILCNDKIQYYTPILTLFQYGYELTKEDFDYLKAFPAKTDKMRMYINCYLIIGTRLEDRALTKDVLQYAKTIFIIESLRLKEMFGIKFKPGEWIRLANYAMDHYKEFWEYFKIALEHYGFSEKLLKLDFSGSYQRKLQDIQQNLPSQNLKFEGVFFDLYPELVGDYLVGDQ